ncbi:MAG: GDP-L-fucose synthase [Pseudomonadota bacterium]
MERDARIYVTGHNGLVGSALVRELQRRGYGDLILADRAQLDLREQTAVRKFFRETRPNYVFVAAGKVGGILANDSYPADFIYDNLMIAANLIHSAYERNVRKLLYLGSSCVYPKYAPQPMCEEDLLSGPLEPTNQWYAVAKIAGIKLCQAYRRQHGCSYIAAMPTNLYGPYDNFNLNTSHVLPALLRKFHEAKLADARQVTVWGTGKPRREFCHVDDCVAACLHLMDVYDSEEIVNIGAESDISIRELAELVQDIVGFQGEIVFDTGRPDGSPVKRMDTSVINALGWHTAIELEQGIRATYDWYVRHKADHRG